MRTKPSHFSLLILALLGLGALSACEVPPESTSPVSESPSGSASLRDEMAGDCQYQADAPVVSNYASLIRSTDAQVGPSDARVTVIEFFEPNCIHCIKLHPTMVEVKQRYDDRVRFVFKPFVNWAESQYQAQAMYAAHAEGKFFEMMGAQFASGKPEQMTREHIVEIADGIGMDGEAMAQRIDGGAYRGKMMADRADFMTTGAQGFPAVYINGQLVESGSRTVGCLSQLIETELDS